MHTNPTSFLKSKLLLVYCSIFLLVIAALYGCKKTDSIYTPQADTGSTAARFFNIPAGTSPAVKRIAAEIQRRNTQKEFITAFAKNNGYPVWDKILTRIHKSPTEGFSNSFQNQSGGTDSSWLIPLVLQDSLTVNGYIQASIASQNDSIWMVYKLAQDYTNYDFNTVTGIGSASAFALTIMELDNMVFGYNNFRITDKRLFSTDTMLNHSLQVKFHDGYSSAQNVIASSNTNGCTSVTVLGYVCATPTYAGCMPNCDALSAQSGICIFGRCYSTSSTYTTCSFDPGDGPGGGGTPPPGGGTPGGPGTGGGGGGSLSPQYPCPNNPNQNCPPPRGPIGWEPIEDEPPCDDFVKGLETNTEFVSKFKSLNEPFGALTAGKETGYYVNFTATTPYQYCEGADTYNDPYINFTLAGGQKINGFLHAHANQTGKVTNIFSPDDIIMMAKVFKHGFAADNNLFFGVTSKMDNPYIIKVTNPQQFLTFADLVIANEGKLRDYETKLKSPIPQKNIIEFFKMLNKITNQSSGLELYTNENGQCNSWSKVNYNPNREEIEIKPCN